MYTRVHDKEKILNIRAHLFYPLQTLIIHTIARSTHPLHTLRAMRISRASFQTLGVHEYYT